MPRAKVDPSVAIIKLFMALPVGEGALLLKHLAAIVEGRLRKVANGEKVKEAKPRTPKMPTEAGLPPKRVGPVSPRPRTAKPLVAPSPTQV